MKMMEDRINVVLYCRVSSDEQAEGSSLDEQERRLRMYCASLKMNVLKVYKDDSSAKYNDIRRRPMFGEMYAYCKLHRHLIAKILFLRWDRYTRNTEFAFVYKRKITDELGIEINALESPIDFRSTEWSLMLALHCGMAHTEDNKISRRTLEGIHGTLLKGKCSNHAPRGYRNVRDGKHNTRVEIDKKTAPVIQDIFYEVAYSPLAPNAICRKYNKRYHLHINKNAFMYMLRNVFYIGKILVPAYNDEPEQIVEGQHEGIINPVIFKAVQERIAYKPQIKISKAENPDLFLKRYLLCPKCGRHLTGYTCKGNGGYYTYYCCSQDKKHINIRAEKANSLFIDYACSITPNPDILTLFKTTIKDIYAEGIGKIDCKMRDKAAFLKEIQAKLDVIDDKYMSGKLSDDQYQRMNGRYRQEMLQTQDEMEMLRNQRDTDIEPMLDYAFCLLSHLRIHLTDAPVDLKIKILGALFDVGIQLSGDVLRTTMYNRVLDVICMETNKLRGEKRKREPEKFNSGSLFFPLPSFLINNYIGTCAGIGKTSLTVIHKVLMCGKMGR
ncbi:recombinase family protein [Prevotella sp. kh1p2]|uniref:recombinase family protein n=1 Tax=Prevotella sp. kh1p2 TaxID=1761883 RepID=UPI0008C5B00A|nr:recombinase family protein [Prevotella sp. kh1p2]SES91761.1 Site-specific DNA recombinase [Prevotella sp. kh1p2]SNU11141.1 Site-specific DNA recombinase [Prevotellaceae bacterium KH2P17]